MKEKMGMSGVAGRIGLLIGGLFLFACSDSGQSPLSSGESPRLALSSAPADTSHNHTGVINAAVHTSTEAGTDAAAPLAQMMGAMMEHFHGTQDTMRTGATADAMMAVEQDTAHAAQMMGAMMEHLHGTQDTMRTGSTAGAEMDSGHSMMGGH